MYLGETAAEIDAGGTRGQGRIDQRVELDHVAAGGAQQFFGFGVAEGERPPTRHRDDGPGRCGRPDVLCRIPRHLGQRLGTASNVHDRLDIDMRGNHFRHPPDGVRGLGPLGRGYQPQVTRRRLDTVVAG